jgi:general stress protein YciG
MAGTYEGGLQAAKTNVKRYGEGFYKEIGKKGGQKSRGGGFAADPELARKASLKRWQNKRKVAV